MNLDWLAGFFDGEGCVTARIHGSSYSVAVEITQKDKTPLEAILQAFPTGYLTSRTRVIYTGTVCTTWSLRYDGAGCKDILLALHDRVVLKKIQVQAGYNLARCIFPKGSSYIPEEIANLREQFAQLIIDSNKGRRDNDATLTHRN